MSIGWVLHTGISCLTEYPSHNRRPETHTHTHSHVTMIDWTNAEEFKDLPLLPEDFTWPELVQVIGEGK